jgi:DNA-binding PadR family transcriptional regulator
VKVKIPPRKQEFILRLLLGKKPCYGLEIASMSNGNLKLQGIYTQLRRMEESGLVCSELESGVVPNDSRRRRFYKITPKGETTLKLIDHILSVQEEDLLPKDTSCPATKMPPSRRCFNVTLGWA